MGKRIFCVIAVIFSIVFFVSFSAWAVPKIINYQGKLTDISGEPLDGHYTMRFSLFDVETDGIPLWEETQMASINQGVFSVQLGAETSYPLDASYFDNENLYLEIAIYNTETLTMETLSPRTMLVSEPFAIKSENSDTLDGMDSSEFALSTHSHHFSTIAGTVSDAQVPNNIRINYAASAGNADTVDGRHASSFTTPRTDAGRYNVVSTLYEGTSSLSRRYVNEGQANSINSNMIQYGAVTSSDISNGSIQKYDLNNQAKCSLDASDGYPTSQVYVNSSGNVGIGDTTPSGKLDVNGNMRIKGGYPIIFRRYSRLGDNINYNTYYSTSTYAAAIVGFFAEDGDINEYNDGNIIKLRMRPYSGEWYIQADFRTHRDHENWYVDVMFVRRELVNMIGY